MFNPIDFKAGGLINHRYRVVSRIGFGSFASAFRVADTKEDDSEKVCKTTRIADDTSNKHELEVVALEKCLGLPRWPQISDHFATKSFKTIVLSHEGVSISDVLEMNTMPHFSIANILRIGYGIFDALHSLHTVGYIHRDVSKENVLLKRVKEGVMVKMIDLGNCAKTDPPPKCLFKGWYTSLHVLKSGVHTPHDDLITALYLLIELSGTEPFNSHLPLLQSKEKLHSHPSTCLDESRRWLGDTMTLIDQLKSQNTSQMTSIWRHLEHAIPEVSPYSPIAFNTVDGRLIVE